MKSLEVCLYRVCGVAQNTAYLCRRDRIVGGSKGGQISVDRYSDTLRFQLWRDFVTLSLSGS